MAATKCVVNLATGHEDAERVTTAYLVAGAAVAQSREAMMFLTKEAVRLALPGYAEAIEVAGAPPVRRLAEQFAEGGGRLLVCPICFDGRQLDREALVANAEIGGATPLWEWIGEEPAEVFSY